MKNIALACLLVLMASTSFANDVKMVAGWVEKVMLPLEKTNMSAKLDTGAYMSSLNADNIHIILKDKKKWVEFDLSNSKDSHKHASYPLIKFISIKARDDEQSVNHHSIRPLIEIKLCIGHQTHNVKFNLIRRKQFNYSMLLGRDALNQFNLAVDPSKKYLIRFNC